MNSANSLPVRSRAAVVRKYGDPISVEEVGLPEVLDNGSLLVEVLACSLCGTDIHGWMGELTIPADLPSVPGHEMVGRIVAFGEGSTTDSFGMKLRIGDRVIWSHAPCGSCEECSHTRDSALCSNPQMYGYLNCESGPLGAGAFSQFAVVLPNSGRVRVPEEVSDELASIAACAIRSAAKAVDTLGRTSASDVILVQGCGPIGLFATAMLSLSMHSELIVIGGPDDRLELARSYGASATISIDDFPTPEARSRELTRITGGARPSKILEMSGGRTAFSEGLELAAKGARYVLMGQVADWSTPSAPGRITMKNLSVLGAFSGSIVYYREALNFLVEYGDEFDFGSMITGKYTLNQVNQAFESMRSFKDIKAVIYPGRV